MELLVGILVRWVIHAAVTVAAVRLITPGNPRNTLSRALLVTFVVAAVVTPMTLFWFLLVPLIVAAIAWIAIYMLAYGLGPLQAMGTGLMQVVIGWLVGVILQMVL